MARNQAQVRGYSCHSPAPATSPFSVHQLSSQLGGNGEESGTGKRVLLPLTCPQPPPPPQYINSAASLGKMVRNQAQIRWFSCHSPVPPPPPPPQYINSAASLGEMARNQAQIRWFSCHSPAPATSPSSLHQLSSQLGGNGEESGTGKRISCHSPDPPPPPPPQYINSAASLGDMAWNQAQVRVYSCHSLVPHHFPLPSASTQQPAWGKWRGIRHR
jgi:hypothetical protein